MAKNNATNVTFGPCPNGPVDNQINKCGTVRGSFKLAVSFLCNVWQIFNVDNLECRTNVTLTVYFLVIGYTGGKVFLRYSDMTTRSEACCGICKAREITKEANKWCCDCAEGHCLECHDIHINSKSSSNHDTIPIESYKQLPSSIARIVNYCETHKMKYENYCQYHDKDCCPACIAADHKSCTDILLLKDVIKAVKTSALLNTIESNIKDIKSNIDHIIADRQQNLDNINEERQRYQNEIKLVRTKVNSHLNKLEQKVLKELDSAENKIKTETTNLMTKLLDKIEVSKKLDEEIVAIKKYATEYQVYIGSKTIENKVEKEETYLQSLFEDGRLRQNCLKMTMNKKLANIETIIETFGTVGTEIGQTLIVLKRGKNKQAQNMSNVLNINKKPLDKLNISRIGQIILSGSMVRSWLFTSFEFQGISLLPNGKIILADSYYKRLLIVNNDGMIDKPIQCPTDGTGPFGVTYIKNNLVAISTSLGIQTVSTQTRTVVQNIATNGECRGIAYNNGALICWVRSIGIQSIQLSNLKIATLVKIDERNDRLGISVHRNKIYVTNYYSNVVNCYTLDGKQLWQAKDIPFLKYPTGITLDKNSYIYVAAYRCVIVLSSNGKESKTIMASKDGFSDPTALHFDQTKNNLIIVNKRQPICVYHISQET
ncbi:unnamed protein product [Mytilus coruscus]|uniref:B box-type domain-containing protein n=1 Tax=Mytilus coruscus TaxID=42192 RepID=A0A6J8D4L5_MYTCO|nr:unnamed protein product [Mytilus coruscus]